LLVVVGVTCTFITLLIARAVIEVLSLMRAAWKLLIHGFARASIAQYDRDQSMSQINTLRIIGSGTLSTLI